MQFKFSVTMYASALKSTKCVPNCSVKVFTCSTKHTWDKVTNCQLKCKWWPAVCNKHQYMPYVRLLENKPCACTWLVSHSWHLLTNLIYQSWKMEGKVNYYYLLELTAAYTIVTLGKMSSRIELTGFIGHTSNYPSRIACIFDFKIPTDTRHDIIH